ncbi:hypothetical protein KI387_042025, partial [Taxus chinensis]
GSDGVQGTFTEARSHHHPPPPDQGVAAILPQILHNLQDVNAALRRGSVGGHSGRHDRVTSIEGHAPPPLSEEHRGENSHVES